VRAALTAFALAYPVLAHLAVARQSPALTVAAAAVLLALIALPGMLLRRPSAFVIAAVGALVLVVLAMRAQASLLLFLPPVLFNAFLAWLFGHTLAAGRVPLIERFIRLVHGAGELPYPGMIAYARGLTLAWTVLCGSLATINATLAIFAVPDGVLQQLGVPSPWPVPLALWSWCANVLNYVVVAAFFVLEYVYRRRRFPRQPYANFADFVRRIAAAGPRLWHEMRGSERGPEHS
jgi:uncharacterized membrane protein